MAAFTGEHDAGLRVLGDRRPRRAIPARLVRLASDDRLAELVRAGSETAFEALFDRHHRGVLGFCRHMLGSVEEAEDAVQHTFMAAYRELVGTEKPLQLRPWLYTIARNRCLTVLRTRRRQAAGEPEEPPTEHLAAAVERRHDLRDLLRDVAALPEDQRAALVLSELGDMPHEEIAAVLGCRREKVKALVFQARSSLIASRAARETPCAEIREQLAVLRGGSLRRTELRRHLRDCVGCREFRDQVRSQRRDLALVLPVVPTVGLKSAVLGATGAAVGAGGAFSGGTAATVLVAAAIAGGGTVAIEKVATPDTRAPRSHTSAPGAMAAVATSGQMGTVTGHGVSPLGHAVSPPGTLSPPDTVFPPGKASPPGKIWAPGQAKHAGKVSRPGKNSAPGQAKDAGKASPPGQVKITPPGQAKAPKPTDKVSSPGQADGHAKPVKPDGVSPRGRASSAPGHTRSAKPRSLSPPGHAKVADPAAPPKSPRAASPPKPAHPASPATPPLSPPGQAKPKPGEII